MKKIVLLIIKIYQKTLSLDHGIFSKIYGRPLCRFQPTCSEYTLESVKRFGVLKGLFFGTKRVLRCHPWNEGGFDLVSENDKKS